jgi:hypothetical protein
MRPGRDGGSNRTILRGAVPWLLVVAACVGLSVFVMRNTRYGVFFSGDGGLKFAMVLRHAQGSLDSVVPVPAEPWARQLWRAGLEPFGPPFAYPDGDLLRVVFPPLFLLLATPAFVVLGPLGLFSLPIAGFAGSLGAIILVARRLGAGFWAAAGAVVTAIASPLILYGAIFWEHTLAAALAIVAVRLFLASGRGAALLSGAVMAVASAVRPECAVFAFALFAVFAVVARDRRRAALASVVLVAWLACSMFRDVTAGVGPVGLHGRQWQFDLVRGLEQSRALIALFFGSFPAAVAGLLALWPSRCRTDREAYALCAASLLTLVMVPFFVPNLGGKQLGPRYLLLLIPPLAVCAGSALSRALRSGRTALACAIAIAWGVAMMRGGQVNLIDFRRDLERDYAMRIAPALAFVRERPERVVVFTHQWNALEFASLLQDRVFLRIGRFDGQPRPDEKPAPIPRRTWPSSRTRWGARASRRFCSSPFGTRQSSRSVPHPRATSGSCGSWWRDSVPSTGASSAAGAELGAVR